MQNDESYFKYGNFKSNPPSTVNTAKFDCLDLSGPPCISSFPRLLRVNVKILHESYFCPLEG